MATTTVAPKTKLTGGSFLLEDHNLENVFTPEDFNEDQQMIVKLADEFAVNELLPAVEKIEHKEWQVTRDLLKKAADMGLTNADVPAEYGGSEMDKISSAIIADQMAKSGSFVVSMGAHAGIGTLPLVFFGTEEQKKKYLPQARRRRNHRRLRAVGRHQRLRRAQQPHSRGSVARWQALHPERREDVDHQRPLRRPVHHLRQGRRRKVHRLPGREGLPWFLGRSRRKEDGHPRLLHRASHPQRLQGTGRECARRNRQGTHHRLQHPQRGPLQARRGMRRRGAHLDCRTPSPMPKTARPLASRSPTSA